MRFVLYQAYKTSNLLRQETAKREKKKKKLTPESRRVHSLWRVRERW